MRIPFVIGFALVIVAGSVSPATGQLIEGPQGAVGGIFGGRRPVDPNRDSQSFEASFDISGGYDEDPNAFLLDPSLGGSDLTQWYASTGSGSARYRAGSVRRSIDARGRAYFNYQSNTSDSLIGGDGTVRGAAGFGRRRLNQLTLEFQSSYEPGWILGAFGSSLGPGPDEPAIGVAPPQGVVEQRWLVLAATAGYEHHWNPRHITTMQYNNRRVRPIEGDGLDGDWQYALLDQSWEARTGLSLVGGYRFDENRQRDVNGEVPPVRYQTLDAGLRFEKRFSASRRYSLAFRGGATQVLDSPAMGSTDSLQPSLTATAEFTTSRFWNVSGEYTRSVMVLAGVSPVPVLNDNVSLNFIGTPTRRLRYSIFGSLARADTVAADAASDNVTDVAGVTGELRYAVATWAAVFASYAYYHHRIQDESLAATGFPPRYDRHSIRIGATFWVPLYGAF